MAAALPAALLLGCCGAALASGIQVRRVAGTAGGEERAGGAGPRRRSPHLLPSARARRPWAVRPAAALAVAPLEPPRGALAGVV